MKKIKLNWGFIGTVSWFLFIGLFAVYKGYELPSSLNELGDALAGIVAPIAFLWLILGYKQQSIQLKQNSIAINQQAEALKQQAESLEAQLKEMHESVDQQKKAVEIQTQNLQILKQQLIPKLYVTPKLAQLMNPLDLENTEVEFNLLLENLGKGEIYDLKVIYDSYEFPLKTLKIIKAYEERNIQFLLKNSYFIGDPKVVSIKIHYEDLLGWGYLEVYNLICTEVPNMPRHLNVICNKLNS